MTYGEQARPSSTALGPATVVLNQSETLPPVALADGMLETISTGLRRDGIALISDAIPTSVLAQLLGRASREPEAFSDAGVGRLDNHRTRADVRRDRIQWLDPDDAATRWYLAWAELLRVGLNAQLFLGLFDYEAHLAWYPEGAFYRTHVDAFSSANPGGTRRRVSTVCYLNPDWQDGDGGELVIYRSHADEIERVVTPDFGTLVLFLSEEFPHEVRPVTRARYSLAGWFRTNAGTNRAIDPPVFEPTDL